jgi:hypothetical protein
MTQNGDIAPKLDKKVKYSLELSMKEKGLLR